MDELSSGTAGCLVLLASHLLASHARTEARVAEPDKCEEWRWCSREELAELPLFPPLRALLETDEGRHALNVVDFLG